MRRKILSLLLAVAMVFSLAVTAHAEETEEKTMDGQIVILHTNDVHGAIAGYAKVAALKDAYEAKGAYVLLMDAGDFIQGDPTVSVSEGATAVELMNMAGYDVVSMGNHEFDYGYENMKTLAATAEFPIVDANVLYNGKVAFEDNVVFTAPDGTKIGVFGLDTPETATKAHPAKIQGVTFLAEDKLFDCAKKQVAALEAEGCDYIVCLGHLGIDDESTGNRSIDLLKKVSGIDVFIDGHSHSTLGEVTAAAEAAGIAGTAVTSTGTKLENVGVVTINGESISATVTALADLTAEDADIAARAAAIQKEIDDDYGTVFAKTEVALNGEKDPGNRTEETNLGDLICDALVWGAKKNGETVDAAVTNGGGIRASIAAGNITKKDINTVLPFGNTLGIVKVTGAELLEALEASTYCTPAAIGGFPQVSGIEFTVDTTVAYDQGDLYPGSTYYGPKSIQRVTIETVGGKAFDPKATYSIATNDFMAAGGDTYYAFAAASVNYDLGIPMDEVVMDYITTELKGVVTAEAYGEPAGRITVELPFENPFADVAETSAYYDGILWAVEEGITTGRTETTFVPGENCTEANILTFLWRANGEPAAETTENPFGEAVSADAYYYKAALWAFEKKMIDETFVPNTACTRAQAVYFMWMAAGSPDDAAAASFTDVAADADYAAAVNWAVAQEVTKGTGDGTTFSPENVCTRGQIVTFLYRADSTAEEAAA
ncbi:5'-nucleotidase C-terminal domain-containing protein [Dysosmobacter sp.]|uniref:5'-nucleotidase C-terminal domain-containing protein n=1 Tax=Dysosmobacter sp. TaxID=2591382 RepID=UPI002A9D9EEF|nr:5'-nucleotidase C-terminal domain-containing protein [Dysosmobacter sp.]MCI6055582.1 5'-nucleotidase C-terminal domain-containing protein [Dysosmobacter sp.]MDY5509048.1 5'-nucleotidase C-terminal domain-containing protein [Dysosmobacter sp.]